MGNQKYITTTKSQRWEENVEFLNQGDEDYEICLSCGQIQDEKEENIT